MSNSVLITIPRQEESEVRLHWRRELRLTTINGIKGGNKEYEGRLRVDYREDRTSSPPLLLTIQIISSRPQSLLTSDLPVEVSPLSQSGLVTG